MFKASKVGLRIAFDPDAFVMYQDAVALLEGYTVQVCTEIGTFYDVRIMTVDNDPEGKFQLVVKSIDPGTGDPIGERFYLDPFDVDLYVYG